MNLNNKFEHYKDSDFSIPLNRLLRQVEINAEIASRDSDTYWLGKNLKEILDEYRIGL